MTRRPGDLDPDGAKQRPRRSTGSTVTDTLPAGITNIQTSTPGCNVAGNIVTCNVGALPASGTTDIEITGDAPNTPSVCFDNDASVTGNEGDPVPGNNDASAQTCTTPAADLEIAKTADAFVSPGGQVTWQLTVDQQRPQREQRGDRHRRPPGRDHQHPDVHPRLQRRGHIVTCNVGALPASGTTDIEITGDAPNTLSVCFDNNASVAGNQADPVPGNNDASATTCTTPAADLEIAKAADAVVDPGGQVTWTLTVTNNGPDASSGSTVTDTLPIWGHEHPDDDPGLQRRACHGDLQRRGAPGQRVDRDRDHRRRCQRFLRLLRQ